jgi:hypothetical protein
MILLDFLIRQIHEIDENDVDIFTVASQIFNVRLHQPGLSRATDAGNDFNVWSSVQFNHSIQIF